MVLTSATPRPLGATGLTVTALGLGTAPLGGLFAPVTTADALATLEAAWSAGLRYFDTAPMYGLGRCEHLLGHALRDRTDWVLSTKVGRLMCTGRAGRSLPPAPPKNPFDTGWHSGLGFREVFDYSYDGVMRSFDDSQQRLGMPRIDIAFVHDIGRTTHGERHAHHWDALTRGGGFRALAELKAAGDIRGFGLGVNETEVVFDAYGECDLDVCLLAGRFTLLDRQGATLLETARTRGTAIVMGGVYNSGILAAPPEAPARYDYLEADAATRARVETLRATCRAHGVPLAAAALHFPLRHPAVAAILVGARSALEVAQTVDWFDAAIPDALWTDLDATAT